MYKFYVEGIYSEYYLYILTRLSIFFWLSCHNRFQRENIIKFSKYSPAIALLFPADNCALLIDSITARTGIEKKSISRQQRRRSHLDFNKIHKETGEQRANQCDGNWNINKRILRCFTGALSLKIFVPLFPRLAVLVVGHLRYNSKIIAIIDKLNFICFLSKTMGRINWKLLTANRVFPFRIIQT